MDKSTRTEIIEYLSRHMRPQRIEMMRKILAERTNRVTIVLEDIYNPQNASATLRTSEGLGLQDVHIIETRNEYQINPMVAKGASRWLRLHRYRTPERNNTAACFQTLRAQGYKLIATSPHPGSITLPEITLDGKLAFLFGNEKEGLTEYALDNADAHLRLPMYGFTESYNITVSVAMVLAYIVDKLRNADVDWRLPEDEQQSLLLEWCRVELRRSDLLEKRYFAERAQKSS